MANGLKQGREDLIAVHVGGDLIAFGKGRAQRSFERLSKGRVTERRRVFPARAFVTLPKNRKRAQHRPRTPADTGESEEPRDGNISRRPRHRHSFRLPESGVLIAGAPHKKKLRRWRIPDR